MRKLSFCSGGFKIPDFECFDMDVDITKPLPFPDGCASHVFVEHGVEHVTHQQAWKFFEECHRILAPKGRIRIAIPDIERMWMHMTTGRGDEYIKLASHEKTAQGAIKSAVFNHGHQACWTGFMLFVVLQCVGFAGVSFYGVGESEDQAFIGVEQHGKTVGEEINQTETTVVEGVKA